MEKWILLLLISITEYCPFDKAPVTLYQTDITNRTGQKIFLSVVVRVWNGTKLLPNVNRHGMYTLNDNHNGYLCIYVFQLTLFGFHPFSNPVWCDSALNSHTVCDALGCESHDGGETSTEDGVLPPVEQWEAGEGLQRRLFVGIQYLVVALRLIQLVVEVLKGAVMTSHWDATTIV